MTEETKHFEDLLAECRENGGSKRAFQLATRRYRDLPYQVDLVSA